MKINVIPITTVAMVAALLVSVQQAQAVEFRGGTAVAANNAEGCCNAVRDNSLFNFNGGVGSLLGISESDRQTLDGLDERNNPNPNGIWNPHPNNRTGNLEGDQALLTGPNQAVFSIVPLAGNELVTGFQVMNATNAQFDERQSESLSVEVSTDGGASFQNVLNTSLAVVDATPGGNQAPAPAQEFLLSSGIGGVDLIRLTVAQVAGGPGASLSEFRVLVDTVVPEPATAGLLAFGIGGFVMRRRRRLA